VLDPRRAIRARFGAVTLAYAGFVAYGSLVPLAFRARPLGDAWSAFLHIPYLQLGIHSRADWVANILLYIPLAFFLSGWLSARVRPAAAMTAALLLCAALAVGIEFAQLFFPPRTVSKNDLFAELIGTALGIALWHYAGAQLMALWDDVQHGGRQGTRALIALYTGAYLAFALFPYDFVISAAELAQKLAGSGRPALLFGGSCGGALACSTKLLTEVLVVVPLGVFFGMVLGRSARPSLWRAFGWGLVLGLVIEGLQTFLASGAAQVVSILTRGIGMALGLGIFRCLRREWLIEYRPHMRFVSLFTLPLYMVLLFAMNGFFTSELQSLDSALRELRSVRFMPFYYHYFTTETQAVYSLLIHAGAYAPIGFVIWVVSDGTRGRAALWTSAIVGFLLALGMEGLKLFLVDKRPDPTDTLIAAVAASLACLAAMRLAQRADAPRVSPRPRPRSGSMKPGNAYFDRS
jgi:VanZ family protein